MSYAWWNFRTQQADYVGPTEETATDFLPQDILVQNFYRLLRERGDSMDDAMIHVLKACTGKR